MVPTIYYFFWLRYHLNRVYSQKKLWLETKYRPFFPPPPNHTLWIPLTVGPPPLYWLGIGWWCSNPCVLASLSSVFVFFHSHAVSVVVDKFCFILLHVFVLFLHVFPVLFVISFGLAFLSITQFLLLTLPAVHCFFSLCFFILVFTPIFLYKRIWVFVGQIMLTGSKGSWAQCLYPSKPFCWRTVFCGKTIFCCRFVFYCRSPSLAFISLDLSCSLVFLVGLWALLFHRAFLCMGFWVRIYKKWASTLS